MSNMQDFGFSFSEAIGRMEESGIRKVFALAAGSKPGEWINLSIGQPDFPTPKDLKKAAQAAIENDFNSYAPTLGLPDLREKIAQKLQVENGISTKSEEVMVTSGTAGGLLLAFGVLLDPGDEVIVPDPYFVLYKQLLDFMGVKVVLWDTYASNFHLEADDLERLITPKTKLLLLNSPNNPTGAVYSQKELEAVAEVAKRHNLTILSDEIYEKFDYDNKFFSIGSIYPKTITLGGFSKSLAIPGWRVGWAQAPEAVIEQMNKLQQYSFVCAPAPAQKALVEAWDQVSIKSEVAEYRQRRDLIWQDLKDYYDLAYPEGAFYGWVKIPKGKPNLVRELLEHKVLMVPGEVFSRRAGYFRISLAAQEEDLKKGIEVLQELV
jgi:aspartate aminotransferase/aminotransferase